MDPFGALFDHHAWAMQRLIDHCAALPADRLQATVPGTRGTIEQTLIHLVAADQRYLQELDGQAPGIRISERESHTRASELDVTLPAYDEDPPSPHAEDLLFLQAIHHGNDHRTHACTILGAHGLDVPDLSGWTYWHEERR